MPQKHRSKRQYMLAGVAALLLVLMVIAYLPRGNDAPTGKARQVRDTQTLLAEIASPDVKVAWQAIIDLGQAWPPQDVAGPLAKVVVEDKRPEVRIAAARTLGRLAVWETLPALFQALNDPERGVRAAANTAIIRILGIDYGFNPAAPEPDRQAAIQRIVDSHKISYQGYLDWMQRREREHAKKPKP